MFLVDGSQTYAKDATGRNLLIISKLTPSCSILQYRRDISIYTESYGRFTEIHFTKGHFIKCSFLREKNHKTLISLNNNNNGGWHSVRTQLEIEYWAHNNDKINGLKFKINQMNIGLHLKYIGRIYTLTV